MPASIVKYQKASTEYSVIELRRPDDADGVQELCTLDGVTYVCVPEGVELPEQPAEITVEPVELDDELRERIKAASPQCQEIDRLQREKIRSQYALEDELKLARIASGIALQRYVPEAGEVQALDAYQQFVESIREWGRVQRAELGL